MKGRVAAGILVLWGLLTVANSYEIKGSVTDSSKLLFQGMMDPGAKWDGVIDEVLAPTATIHAFNGTKELTHTRLDTQGKYSLTVNEGVTHIGLNIGGGGVYLEQQGPWEVNAVVDFDYPSIEKFTVSGSVKNKDGSPKTWEMVKALDFQKKMFCFAYTRPNGEYQMITNKPVQFIASSADRQQILREGPWIGDAVVDLAMDPSKKFKISGHVWRKPGETMGRTRVMFFDGNGKSLKAVMSKEDGYYEMETDQVITKVLVYNETYVECAVEGKWESDATVDLNFGGLGLFTIQGKVTNPAGEPLFRIWVNAETASKAVDAKTDKEGHYTLEVNEPVKNIYFYGQETKSVEGPWDKDTELNMELKG